MTELDRDKLHAYFSEKAKAGLAVTVKEVAQHFDVEEGGANKAMSILTGNGVLIYNKSMGSYDCSRVPELSKLEFASAASQGRTNTAFVDGLWSKISILKKNNDTMKMRLLEAQERIAELEKSK